MNEPWHFSPMHPESDGERCQSTDTQKFYTYSEKFMWGQWRLKREIGLGSGLVVTEGLLEEIALEMSLGT